MSSKEKSWYQMVKSHVQNKLYPELLEESEPVTEVQERYKFEGVQPVCA